MFNSNIIFYFKRNDTSDFKVHLHTHKCYEMVYYHTGKGYCRIANKKYEYTSGSCVIIPPEQTHNDVHKSSCNLYCVGFSVENDFPLQPGTFFDSSGKIYDYLSMIDTEFKEKKNDFMIAVNNLLENILLEIKRSSMHYVEKNQKFNNTINLALNYINEYFLTDISGDQIASLSNYSYDRFRHIFKEIMHVSPKQYIIAKRLEYSKKLLSTTTFSVTEISYQCGFATTSYFIQIFKQATNITPMQYRRQLHSEMIFSPKQTQ